jgi:hypothetical protein
MSNYDYDFGPKKIDHKLFKFTPKQAPAVLARLRSIEIASELDLEIPTFVEIGTFLANGAFTVVTSLNSMDRKSEFFTVDLNQSVVNPFSKKQENWKPSEHYERLVTSITGPCQHAFVEGSSQEVADMFGDIAWCFIDGCHCLECCVKDMELYLPKIVSGGILLIDDTIDNQFAQEDSQWYHDINAPRKYGVIEAIESSEMLRDEFKLLCNITKYRGIMIWRKK